MNQQRVLEFNHDREVVNRIENRLNNIINSVDSHVVTHSFFRQLLLHTLFNNYINRINEYWYTRQEIETLKLRLQIVSLYLRLRRMESRYNNHYDNIF